MTACGGDAVPAKEADEPTTYPQMVPAVAESAAVWALGGMYVRPEPAVAPTVRPDAVLPEPVAPPVVPRGAGGVVSYEGRQARFAAGYLEAGGDPALLAHIIFDVIPCEYGWGEYVKVNAYESRAQFHPGSWARAGGGDPADDYTVGRNVATWISLIADPGSTSGWPVCWHRGEW